MFSILWSAMWLFDDILFPFNSWTGASGLWQMLSVAVIPVVLAVLCGRLQRDLAAAGLVPDSLLPAASALWIAACAVLWLFLPDLLIPWSTYLYWAVWAYAGILVGDSVRRRAA